MYRSPFLHLLALAVTLCTGVGTAWAKAEFYFQWPNSTYSCQPVPITWSGGQAPFTVWIVPVYGSPFFYPISDSYYQDGYGSTEILLQLAAGVNYVVIMSDATGLGSGGSSEIQTVGTGNDTSCMTWASSRAVSLDFTFTVSGQAVQCERGFETSWTGGLEYGPYNMTVIPLDKSFLPYDVSFETGVISQSSWVLDLPAGTRFNVMMNSGTGYGRGGTSGIIEVASSNDTSCLDFDPQPTGAWPVTVTTGSLPPPTLPITQSAVPSGGSGGKLSGRAIAGIIVGLLVFGAIVGVALFYLLRRKKQRVSPVSKMDGHPVDLAEEGPDGDMREGGGVTGGRTRSTSEPMVEPYRQVGTFFPPDGVITPNSENASLYSPGTTTSATRLTASAPRVQSSSQTSIDLADFSATPYTEGRQQNSVYSAHSQLSDGDARPSGPGLAEPLPSKSSMSASSSTNSQVPSLSYMGQRLPSPPPRVARTGTPSSDQSKPTAATPRYPDYSARPTSTQGGMRIVNHDSPDSLPALPPGATHGHSAGPRRRPPPQETGPTFRRHADAGRYEMEVVDLPPLYSEVPRDNPDAPQRSDHGT
ncbi:hypothetical protein IAU60_000765 [Kwoniella sp. DSM 27419]